MLYIGMLLGGADCVAKIKRFIGIIITDNVLIYLPSDCTKFWFTDVGGAADV